MGVAAADGDRNEGTGGRTAWDRCAEMLRPQVSGAVWAMAFQDARQLDLTDECLVLAVPSTVAKERIEARYLSLVHDALAGRLVSVRLASAWARNSPSSSFAVSPDTLATPPASDASACADSIGSW